MAVVYIHPTQRTPSQIEALQARTGLIAVISGTGCARLVRRPSKPVLVSQSPRTPGFDPNWPPGAA